jgi:hypothetical protein
VNGDDVLTITRRQNEAPGKVPVLSRYVERFWLPVAGPSVLALARLLAVETPEPGMRITARELAHQMALKPSKLGATFTRACQFELLIRRGHESFEVPTHVRLLRPRHVAGLSPAMQALHAGAIRTVVPVAS